MVEVLFVCETELSRDTREAKVKVRHPGIAAMQ